MYGLIVAIAALCGQTDALSQINAIRSAHGLPAVTWDASAASEAASNSSYQAVGHFVFAGLQNSAMAADTASAYSMWMSSPAHRSLILHPSLVSIGYSQIGMFHTLSGRTGYEYSQSYTAMPGGYQYRESYRSRPARRSFRPFRGLFGGGCG